MFVDLSVISAVGGYYAEDEVVVTARANMSVNN
jgi:hypothetical protein